MQRHILSRSLTLALMAGTLLAGCKEGPASASGAMPPSAVDVVTLNQTPLKLTTELSGRTSAHRIAEVRPQVNGIILKRYFVEGSDVKAGQVLYQIDPATYEAAVASAEASLAKAEATEQSARLKAKRYAELVKVKAISTQDYDDAQASWKQAVAEIAAAKAALKSARIDLGYTKVRATISGRIGKSSVTEGALVTAQQAASLTTIQQLDPIYVDVTQSTTDLLQLRQLYASGQLEHTQDGAVVHFVLENGAAYPHSGKLEFSDVTVDETTGMVTVRALAPNPDRLLLPGMFVRAILTQGEQPNGLLVPQAAVSRTAKGGASVLLVNADNKVEQREIEVGRAFHGNWVVESGLKGGERVIVAGLQKVRPGAEVAPKDVTPATPAKQ